MNCLEWFINIKNITYNKQIDSLKTATDKQTNDF